MNSLPDNTENNKKQLDSGNKPLSGKTSGAQRKKANPTAKHLAKPPDKTAGKPETKPTAATPPRQGAQPTGKPEGKPGAKQGTGQGAKQGARQGTKQGAGQGAKQGAGQGMKQGAGQGAKQGQGAKPGAALETVPEAGSDAKPGPNPNLDVGPPGFKVKFDFENEYKGVDDERPLRWRREKRTGCIGGILYSAFVLCISLIMASLAWLATTDVLGFGAVDEEVNITVPKNFEIEDITEMLYDAELIKYKFLFNMYAGFSSADEKITSGSYVLNKNFDYRAMVHGMTARGGARVETEVTIPEGYTLAQIFTLLEDRRVCEADELWRAATRYDFKYDFLDNSTLGNRLRLEGYLFPDTYLFYMGSTPEQALSKMLGEFNRKFTDDYAERAEWMGYTVDEIVTIASMIEREAGSDEERPRIAAVIYNRLNSRDFQTLQIDATIYYAIAGTGIPFSTDIDSPYNSYRNAGLPPGPIANPGLESIRAALYPMSTNEYYYALGRSGTHEFFSTLAQHQAFVQSDEYGGR